MTWQAVVTIVLPFLLFSAIVVLMARWRNQPRRERRRRYAWAALGLITAVLVSVIPNLGAVHEQVSNPKVTPPPVTPPPVTPTQTVPSTPPPPAPSLEAYPERPGLKAVKSLPEDFVGVGGYWKLGDFIVPLIGENGARRDVRTHAVGAILSGCDGPRSTLHFRMYDNPASTVHQKYRNFTLGLSSNSVNKKIDVVGTMYTYTGDPISFTIRYGKPFRTQLDVRTTVNVDVNMVVNPTSPLCAKGDVQVVLFDSFVLF